VSNLTRKYTEKATLNFSGNTAELVYPGGEYNFINSMIYDSKAYAKNVRWFTSLVSKGENLFGLYTQLGKVEVAEHKVIEMGTGNKVTRILAWRF
jgi:23S rRNA (adenine1618-N6)-methyltransferase